MEKFFENELFLKQYHEEYCTGVFSDTLDILGYRHQVISDWKVNSSNHRCFGKIRTLELEEIECDDERIDLGLSFLGSLGPGDIFVVNGSHDFAYFGELMTRLSLEVGIEGVVIDGLTRDTFFTHNAPLPIFARGYTPKDIKGRGRVKETDASFEISGVKIKSGDYLFGDNDAVVIIPQEILSDCFKRANEMVEEEAEIKQKIKNGTSIKDILLKHKGF